MTEQEIEQRLTAMAINHTSREVGYYIVSLELRIAALEEKLDQLLGVGRE